MKFSFFLGVHACFHCSWKFKLSSNLHWSNFRFIVLTTKVTLYYLSDFFVRRQFFLLYFVAGLKKLDLDWVSGYSMNELSRRSWVFSPFKWVGIKVLQRFGFRFELAHYFRCLAVRVCLFNRYFMTDDQVDLYMVHYVGLTLDLVAGYLLFFDVTRIVGTFFTMSFHLMNSQIFSIGKFNWSFRSLICISEPCMVSRFIACHYDRSAHALFRNVSVHVHRSNSVILLGHMAKICHSEASAVSTACLSVRCCCATKFTLPVRQGVYQTRKGEHLVALCASCDLCVICLMCMNKLSPAECWKNETRSVTANGIIEANCTRPLVFLPQKKEKSEDNREVIDTKDAHHRPTAYHHLSTLLLVFYLLEQVFLPYSHVFTKVRTVQPFGDCCRYLLITPGAFAGDFTLSDSAKPIRQWTVVQVSLDTGLQQLDERFVRVLVGHDGSLVERATYQNIRRSEKYRRNFLHQPRSKLLCTSCSMTFNFSSLRRKVASLQTRVLALVLGLDCVEALELPCRHGEAVRVLYWTATGGRGSQKRLNLFRRFQVTKRQVSAKVIRSWTFVVCHKQLCWYQIVSSSRVQWRLIFRMFDPRVDILTAEWHPFRPVSWVQPLMVDLSDWRERLMQLEKDVYNQSNDTDVVFIADFPGIRLGATDNSLVGWYLVIRGNKLCKWRRCRFWCVGIQSSSFPVVGLSLDQFIPEDLGNTTLEILNGEVIVELNDRKTNFSLKAGDVFHVCCLVHFQTKIQRDLLCRMWHLVVFAKFCRRLQGNTTLCTQYQMCLPATCTCLSTQLNKGSFRR